MLNSYRIPEHELVVRRKREFVANAGAMYQLGINATIDERMKELKEIPEFGRILKSARAEVVKLTKLQFTVLCVLRERKDRKFYTRDIRRIAGVRTDNAMRVLNKLTNAGLATRYVVKDRSGKQVPRNKFTFQYRQNSLEILV